MLREGSRASHAFVASAPGSSPRTRPRGAPGGNDRGPRDDPVRRLLRSRGLRVNEYGRKTLEILIVVANPARHFLLTLVQHLVISWIAAVPLLWGLSRVEDRRLRVLIGAGYGAAFYVAINSWALPRYFGDPTPWALGVETVYPSLAIHLVYGVVLGLVARPPGRARGPA